MDSGDIIFQPCVFTRPALSQELIDALVQEIYYSMDSFLPKLKKGLVESFEQNEAEATYLGVRRPLDGLIDWNQKAENIFRLIRAVSKPLPGAFTLKKNTKITIWKARVAEEPHIRCSRAHFTSL